MGQVIVGIARTNTKIQFVSVLAPFLRLREGSRLSAWRHIANYRYSRNQTTSVQDGDTFLRSASGVIVGKNRVSASPAVLSHLDFSPRKLKVRNTSAHMCHLHGS